MHRKVLITGANGFVARYLVPALKSFGYEVIGVDIAHQPSWSVDKYYCCDLIECDAIRSLLSLEKPEAIVHLAAVSSVAQSWQTPVGSYLHNTTIFLNLVESVRMLKLQTRIISVGSSEEYGNIQADDLPVVESHPLAPCSPYAVARVSQEQLSHIYANGYGLDIVMTRSFNQTGPGQRSTFVIPSFVKQLSEGKAAGRSVVKVKTGDLSIVRDFLDVRDAVSAYMLLLEKGVSGEVYNICSGKGIALREVLEIAAKIVGVKLDIEFDQSLVRPVDGHVVIGDNSKIRSIGWKIGYHLEKTIFDMINVSEEDILGK